MASSSSSSSVCLSNPEYELSKERSARRRHYQSRWHRATPVNVSSSMVFRSVHEPSTLPLFPFPEEGLVTSVNQLAEAAGLWSVSDPFGLDDYGVPHSVNKRKRWQLYDHIDDNIQQLQDESFSVSRHAIRLTTDAAVTNMSQIFPYAHRRQDEARRNQMRARTACTGYVRVVKKEKEEDGVVERGGAKHAIYEDLVEPHKPKGSRRERKKQEEQALEEAERQWRETLAREGQRRFAWLDDEKPKKRDSRPQQAWQIPTDIRYTVVELNHPSPTNRPVRIRHYSVERRKRMSRRERLQFDAEGTKDPSADESPIVWMPEGMGYPSGIAVRYSQSGMVVRSAAADSLTLSEFIVPNKPRRTRHRTSKVQRMEDDWQPSPRASAPPSRAAVSEAELAERPTVAVRELVLGEIDAESVFVSEDSVMTIPVLASPTRSVQLTETAYRVVSPSSCSCWTDIPQPSSSSSSNSSVRAVMATRSRTLPPTDLFRPPRVDPLRLTSVHDWALRCYSSQSTSRRNSFSSICCSVCYCDYEEEGEWILADCREHGFCKTCWLTALAICMSTNAAPLKCLATDCRAVVSPLSVLAVADPKDALRYLHLVAVKEARDGLDERQTLGRCRECSSLLASTSASSQLECSACSTRQCARLCGQQTHEPLSCELAQRVAAMAEKAKGVTPEDMGIFSMSLARCGRCQVPCDRDYGCNHMVCPVCSAEFCYNCCAKWSGSHYVCKRKRRFEMRFVDERKSGISNMKNALSRQYLVHRVAASPEVHRLMRRRVFRRANTAGSFDRDLCLDVVDFLQECHSVLSRLAFVHHFQPFSSRSEIGTLGRSFAFLVHRLEDTLEEWMTTTEKTQQFKHAPISVSRLRAQITLYMDNARHIAVRMC